MDMVLWKAKVKSGQESLAREWIEFLRINKEEGEKTLKNEREYLEIYFISEENGAMYLYLFIFAEDLEYANKVASASENPLDTKHFEYMTACLNEEDLIQIRPELTLMSDLQVKSEDQVC